MSEKPPDLVSLSSHLYSQLKIKTRCTHKEVEIIWSTENFLELFALRTECITWDVIVPITSCEFQVPADASDKDNVRNHS